MVGKTGTYIEPALEAVREPNHSISPQLFLAGKIRSFDWFEIGEKENHGRRPGREPASAERHCAKLKSVSKLLIINTLLVEAAGVELITMLTTRKLLILGTATTAKKAPLPNPLYVYCTKCFSLWSPTDTTWRPQYRTDSQ